jgi:hypothetical protein
MSEVTEIHEEKETLQVDIELPGHEARGSASALFERTKKELIERVGGRCYICNGTAEEIGSPLEAHHHPVERSMATGWDWPKFQKDCEAGLWGPYAAKFDWSTFNPKEDPYKFVDDMSCNGQLLCAKHHRGKDEGKHDLPYPIWIWQKYALEGYVMSSVETIHDFV